MINQIKNILSIEKFIEKNKLKKIFIISGKNSFFKTKANRIFSTILKKNENFLYLKKKNLPEYEEIKHIINLKEKIRPDLIVAIGGGCVLDLAKISSVFNSSKKLKSKIINSEISKVKTKVLAIPTTAGSGAEVTSNAVIYLDNFKHSVEGKNIKPDFFCLIPELLFSSSKKLDAASSFDAISQAVESLFSVKSNKESILNASRSLKILLSNYENFFTNKNILNAYNMSVGANLSGRSINISKTIAPHALSYPFTTIYGIPHGHAVSLTFNKILKLNYMHQSFSISKYNLKKRYQLLFDITKTKNIYDLDNYFLNIKKKLNLEQDYKKLGININKNISKFLTQVNEQRLINNPVKLLKNDIISILEEF